MRGKTSLPSISKMTWKGKDLGERRWGPQLSSSSFDPNSMHDFIKKNLSIGGGLQDAARSVLVKGPSQGIKQTEREKGQVTGLGGFKILPERGKVGKEGCQVQQVRKWR